MEDQTTDSFSDEQALELAMYREPQASTDWLQTSLESPALLSMPTVEEPWRFRLKSNRGTSPEKSRN